MEITGIRLILLILLILSASAFVNMMIRSYDDRFTLRFDESECPNGKITIQLENGKISNTNFVCSSSDTSEESFSDISEGFNAYIGKNDLNNITDDNGIQSTIIATDSSKPRIFLRQGYHTTPSERNLVNRDEAIINPRHDDILRYNGPGCFESGGTEKIRRVELVPEPPIDGCRNNLKIASVNTGRRLTLTADGEVVDQNVNYYIPQTYLGASGQRVGMPTGYPSLDNITRDLGEPADIDQIGSIPVNNYEGEPVPIGSILMS